MERESSALLVATDATLVALDKSNGETIWTSKVPDSTASSGRPDTAPSQGRSSFGGRSGGPPPNASQRGGQRDSRDPGGATSTAVTGTKDPGLFVGEHWGMRAFSCKIPNGKYLAKLYFAETYAGITGPGQRVFSLKVQGREFKDFDIWAKAGGPRRAYIETVPVEVTNGEFRIVFTAQTENPAINAIEIVPQPRMQQVRRHPKDNTDQGRPVHAVHGFERKSVAAGSRV